MLEVRNLNARYDFLHVLWDVSLRIEEGEYVCLIGPNGAGKSTTLKAIAGLIEVDSGEVLFKGKDISRMKGDQVCRMGISLVSEEMNLFTGMTVSENLAMGAYAIRDRKKKAALMDFVFELFPRLKERRFQLAGTLSGGERKMLAIGRSLMSDPSLLLVDEPSLGLAPRVVDTVFEALGVLNKKGVTILLVEQNVTKTLQVVDRGYVLERGRIVIEGSREELSRNEHIRKIYLGV